MIIVTIAGGPGKTFGACVQGAALALGGVLLGSAFFAILAQLGHYPVAQGVVFALMVYGQYTPIIVSCSNLPVVLSIIKTFGLKWFAFSLLAILMTFNGVSMIRSPWAGRMRLIIYRFIRPCCSTAHSVRRTCSSS